MADINDFGFTFDDSVDQALKTSREEIQLKQNTIVDTNKLVDDLRSLNREMYNKILILLQNLKKNPEKPMINWPNRETSINKFIEELTALRVKKDPNERITR